MRMVSAVPRDIIVREEMPWEGYGLLPTNSPPNWE